MVSPPPSGYSIPSCQKPTSLPHAFRIKPTWNQRKSHPDLPTIGPHPLCPCHPPDQIVPGGTPAARSLRRPGRYVTSHPPRPLDLAPTGRSTKSPGLSFRLCGEATFRLVPWVMFFFGNGWRCGCLSGFSTSRQRSLAVNKNFHLKFPCSGDIKIYLTSPTTGRKTFS